MKRRLRYILAWWFGSKKMKRRYWRGKQLEKIVSGKIIGGDIRLVDECISHLLASPHRPVLYCHGIYKDREIYCLHLTAKVGPAFIVTSKKK